MFEIRKDRKLWKTREKLKDAIQEATTEFLYGTGRLIQVHRPGFEPQEHFPIVEFDREGH